MRNKDLDVLVAEDEMPQRMCLDASQEPSTDQKGIVTLAWSINSTCSSTVTAGAIVVHDIAVYV